MARFLVAVLLIAHGLAHASAGIWVSGAERWWLAVPLWWIAALGFIVTGTSLLGFGPMLRRWRPVVVISSLSSLALIALSGQRVFLLGVVIDVIALFVVFGHSQTVDAGFWVRPSLRRPARIIVTAFIAYTALVVGARPWYVTWGSTLEERQASLPGDPVVSDARYRIDHAVTIGAPVDSVWPWLAQIGQDRAGFYSYDWLERAFGDHVNNADRIHPEWQQRKVGDLVRAAQHGYLGGIFGDDPGWRITAMQPGRAIVLEGWGGFVLRPLDNRTTRLHIRTRGNGTPTLATIPLAPLGVLVFEPAHFIMQRSMMLGIKHRAERMISM